MLTHPRDEDKDGEDKADLQAGTDDLRVHGDEVGAVRDVGRGAVVAGPGEARMLQGGQQVGEQRRQQQEGLVSTDSFSINFGSI